MQLPSAVKGAIEKLSPRQRQWGTLIGIFSVAVVVLWAVFSASEKPKVPGAQQPGAGKASRVTNVGVMPGVAQVSPVDQWIGTAGRKLAEYEKDRAEQDKQNKNQQEFQKNTMERFARLEEQLRSQVAGLQAQAAAPKPAPAPAVPPASVPTVPTPVAPPRVPGQSAGMPPGTPVSAVRAPERIAPALVRVSLADPAKTAQAQPGSPSGGASKDGDTKTGTLDTYLPVSFTRGILLGGLDAPTGGQSQANPHPVLIRLEDNAVLPNRFRSDVKECFVVAAGYGDISSERAYLRTENLSCVRRDGSTLEVKIQGSVYGEDGKVGVRGRLVTKQGQILANALLAGIVSGLGQGLATQSTSFSTSSFGTVATTSGNDALKAGLGAGVGRALDRLAQYYIKLAEQTFPVIEVDAGREVDVVITKGVRIEAGDAAKAKQTSAPGRAPASEDRYARSSNSERNVRAVSDEDY